MIIAQPDHSNKFPAEVTDLRLQLRKNGYEPLPACGEKSRIKRWPRNDKDIRRLGWLNDEQEIRYWAERDQDKPYPATSTVVDATFAPALLIDTSIGPAAEAAEKVAREYLKGRGDICVCHCGPTKRFVPLRTDEPFAKLSRTFFCPNDDEHQIGILADGQQYLVDGNVDGRVGGNPRWLGGDLRTIQHKNLPDTRHEDGKQLLDAIVRVWVEQFGLILENPTTRLQWMLNNARKAEARVAAREAANPEPTPHTLQEIRKLTVGLLKENNKELSFTINEVSHVLDRKTIVGLLKGNNKERNFTVDDIMTVVDICCFDQIADWRDRLRHHVETIWAELSNKEVRQRKIIRIAKGEIARIVDEAEAALLAVADIAPIMVRAGMLVQPITDQLPASRGRMTQVVLLRPLTNANIIYLLNKHAAIFAQYDARSKKWLAVDPPDNVATQLLQKGQWRFPKVAGIITAPTLRPDGSVLGQPGYDPATQLWYAPDRGVVMPPLTKHPTREQAEQALALLQGLLVNFPFVSDVDLAVALAAILTPVLRGAFDVAPMPLFRAHDVGSGKSFFVDLISTVARGRPCPVITFVDSVEEMEKRLGALVLEGVPLISLDNCSGNIGGDLLCQMTERPVVRIRILGRSETPECEWRGVLYGTGNNVTFLGDMTRRGFIANFDPKCERPELRTFDFDPIERVLKNRGAYIAAALTIARAYITAGSPKVCGPLGSYSGWSRFVRSPLVWLGKEDPIKSMEEMRQEDPGRQALHTLIELWREYLTLNTPYTANELASRANELANPIGEYGEPEPQKQPELRELLLQQAGTPRSGEISTKALGNWLMSVHGRVHAGMCIKVMKESRYGNRYALVELA